MADTALPADAVVVARLRARDEAMFAALIGAWSPGMLRAARAYVADDHTAQDVVQETWLGVLRGIDSFHERSSLRTWVYRILVNKAKTRGVRDARTVPGRPRCRRRPGPRPGRGPGPVPRRGRPVPRALAQLAGHLAVAGGRRGG